MSASEAYAVDALSVELLGELKYIAVLQVTHLALCFISMLGHCWVEMHR